MGPLGNTRGGASERTALTQQAMATRAAKHLLLGILPQPLQTCSPPFLGTPCREAGLCESIRVLCPFGLQSGWVTGRLGRKRQRSECVSAPCLPACQATARSCWPCPHSVCVQIPVFTGQGCLRPSWWPALGTTLLLITCLHDPGGGSSTPCWRADAHRSHSPLTHLGGVMWPQ